MYTNYLNAKKLYLYFNVLLSKLSPDADYSIDHLVTTDPVTCLIRSHPRDQSLEISDRPLVFIGHGEQHRRGLVVIYSRL